MIALILLMASPVMAENPMRQITVVGEGRDVQTNNISLSPQWENGKPSNSDQPRITGFVASNILTVRVRDLDDLGDVLDAVVQNGANTFLGLNFGLQNPQPAMDAARQDAITDARRKAKLYADAAGVTLGKVLTITESAGGMARPMMRMMEADMMQRRAAPVAQGELSVTASISMVFEISQLDGAAHRFLTGALRM